MNVMLQILKIIMLHLCGDSRKRSSSLFWIMFFDFVDIGFGFLDFILLCYELCEYKDLASLSLLEDFEKMDSF